MSDVRDVVAAKLRGAMDSSRMLGMRDGALKVRDVIQATIDDTAGITAPRAEALLLGLQIAQDIAETVARDIDELQAGQA